MDRVYFLENQGEQDVRDNSPIFKLIKELKINDDNIFSDIDAERPELHSALEVLQSGDWLIVRSIQDLADDETDLLDVLQKLSNKGVELSSCQEQYLTGNDYLKVWEDTCAIIQFYKGCARDAAYQKAKSEGRVGRPPKTEIEKAIKLYNSGCFTVAEIEKQTGVSKSTLYRYKGKEQ